MSGSLPFGPWVTKLLRILLYLSALGVFVALAVQSRQFNQQAPYLATSAGDATLMTLQAADGADQAAAVLSDWARSGSLGCALLNLDLDRTFILLYGLLGVLVSIIAVVSIPAAWRSRRLTTVLVALPLLAPLAGLADTQENVGLREQIHLAAGSATPQDLAALTCPPAIESRRPPPSFTLELGAFREAVARTRLFAMLKFLLLIGATAGLVMVLGVHAVRLRTRGADPGGITNGSFAALVNAELAAIQPARPNDPTLNAYAGPAGEQWVRYRDSEIVGLGLSGGGIRSATFNLGLLQGFARIGQGTLLRFIDYLATVSGGGYIGGAWSAFLSRARPGGSSRDFFLRTDEHTSRGGAGETEPVRHLREFSNFLVPRLGFFSVEMWQAVVVVIAGIVPSLLVAASVLVLSLFAYVATTSHVALPDRTPGIVLTTALAAAMLIGSEARWRRQQSVSGDAERNNQDGQHTIYMWAGTLAILLLAVLLVRMPHNHAVYSVDPARQWAWALGIAGVDVATVWWKNWHLFDSALAAAMCAVVLLAMRVLLLLLRRTGNGEPVLIALDRVLMRMVALSVLFAAVAAIWHLGINLQHLTGWLLALTASSGGAFALLRNWLTTLRKPQAPGPLDPLKALLPQVLAYLTIVLAAALIVTVLVGPSMRHFSVWIGVAAVAVVVLSLALFVDPQTFGLHTFYRDRIARAYVGASNPLGPTARQNRQFNVRPDDDVALDSLRGRPMHLVCCAANDLAADPVASLSRGARSAVLSQQGVSVGDAWASTGDLSLASALTASAAAFNSNMGGVSVELGPAVTFLMSALNLRLGLWVRHPASTRRRPLAMPGLLFYQEMFQATAVDDRDDVHLSDGAHFDNLGLYELVRRHCRYIIISDASADPDVAFDDFGVAARRVRQDFGVDIRIDLGPLKPDAGGYSRQHMVVGSIDYGSLDQGTLLYIKPTLTGDEEPDIRQYRKRNDAFPHETTGDQFYDEAQWESYRRLGVHVADAAFQFVDRLADEQLTARGVFTEARREWYPTSPDLAARVISMTTRLTAIECDLRTDEAATIAPEVFPELAAITSTLIAGQRIPDPSPADIARAEAVNLSWVLRVLQLMEDTWVQCELDTLWNHPLNLGWMNVFARWATAPTFQMWWPVLSPMYGSGFLRFMRERFPILALTASASDPGTELPAGTVALEPQTVTSGIASTMWPHVLNQPLPATGKVFSYTITLTRNALKVPLQVGLVAMDVDQGIAHWRAEHFFIPPSLWSGGIGSAFLAQLLAALKEGAAGQSIRMCRVTFSESRQDPASKAEQIGYLDFYQPAGFNLSPIEDGQAPRRQELELVRKFSVPVRLARLPDRIDIEQVDALSLEWDADFWRIYNDAFPASERDPRAVVLATAAAGTGFVLRARRDDTTIGLLVANVLRDPAVIFVVYLAVDPHWRSQRVGSALLASAETFGTRHIVAAGGAMQGLVWEIDDPARADDEAERAIRLRRRRFFERAGGQALDVPYLQPPIDGHSVVAMQLMHKPGAGGRMTTAASRLVQAIYDQKYGALNGIPRDTLDGLRRRMESGGL
ncbi:MAG TPA: GNAT family N-acetyltransferase [Vicinamibacterales bacterium]|nr:GNAT family N-acetyltransferase [Vicinamibacterales bacterium]